MTTFGDKIKELRKEKNDSTKAGCYGGRFL